MNINVDICNAKIFAFNIIDNRRKPQSVSSYKVFSRHQVASLTLKLGENCTNYGASELVIQQLQDELKRARSDNPSGGGGGGGGDNYGPHESARVKKLQEERDNLVAVVNRQEAMLRCHECEKERRKGAKISKGLTSAEVKRFTNIDK